MGYVEERIEKKGKSVFEDVRGKKVKVEVKEIKLKKNRYRKG